MAEQTRTRSLTATRTLGAVALLLIGGVHYQQYRYAFYSGVPTIGPCSCELRRRDDPRAVSHRAGQTSARTARQAARPVGGAGRLRRRGRIGSSLC